MSQKTNKNQVKKNAEERREPVRTGAVRLTDEQVEAVAGGSYNCLKGGDSIEVEIIQK